MNSTQLSWAAESAGQLFPTFFRWHKHLDRRCCIDGLQRHVGGRRRTHSSVTAAPMEGSSHKGGRRYCCCIALPNTVDGHAVFCMPFRSHQAKHLAVSHLQIKAGILLTSRLDTLRDMCSENYIPPEALTKVRDCGGGAFATGASCIRAFCDTVCIVQGRLRQ